MEITAIMVLAVLGFFLVRAAIRAANTLKAHDAAQAAIKPVVPTYYTGPTYSRHGNEIKGR